MKIGTKLISATAALAVMTAGLSVFAFVAMNEEASIAKTIVHDRLLPLEQLKTVADKYAVDIVDTVHKVRGGSLTAAEGGRNVAAARSSIDKAWSAYKGTFLTADETVLARSFEDARLRADVDVTELASLLEAADTPAIARFADHKLYPAIDPLGKSIQQLVDLQIAVAKEEEIKGIALGSRLTWLMAWLSALAGAIAVFGMWTIIGGVVRPLNALSASMLSLADGRLDVAVPGEGRHDEIGKMAGAVLVFKQGAVERMRLEEAAEAARSASETERLQRERLQAQEAEDIRDAVDGLAEGLGALADGKLHYRLERPFVPSLDKTRHDFNSAIMRVAEVIRDVGRNAEAIAAGSGQVRASADDLSRRTEQQAASVEETAAALEEISTTVTDSSRRAEEAGRLVAMTRENAQRSGTIVDDTISAMTEIEKSSREINNIIGVIDEIAFQTNLLALNAGVEAARAGDHGKGFAVVAQEVRELAQRSAVAAKEIKNLIARSEEHVRNGVDLVAATGGCLAEIVRQVDDINLNVSSIVESSREQATGIQEINHAVSLMDQSTQQNAAMVEEATAASHSLAHEASELFKLVGRFDLIGGSGRPVATVQSPHPEGVAAAVSPARRLLGRVANSFASGATAESRWEDF